MDVREERKRWAVLKYKNVPNQHFITDWQHKQEKNEPCSHVRGCSTRRYCVITQVLMSQAQADDRVGWEL